MVAERQREREKEAKGDGTEERGRDGTSYQTEGVHVCCACVHG